jgi:hypothetical protein
MSKHGKYGKLTVDEILEMERTYDPRTVAKYGFSTERCLSDVRLLLTEVVALRDELAEIDTAREHPEYD